MMPTPSCLLGECVQPQACAACRGTEAQCGPRATGLTLDASCRKTFPSQHATLSAFAAVYVSVSPGRPSWHPGCPRGDQRP